MKKSEEAKFTEKVNVISPVEAILVVIATFFLFLFLGAIVLLEFGTGPTLVFGELVILIVPLGYLMLKNIDVRRYVGIDVKPKLILAGIISGLALFLLDIVVSGAMTFIFGASKAVEESNALIVSLTSSTQGLILVVVSLSLAGICEEFAFRGFLQNTINRKYSFLPSAIIAAVAFGIFHFDPQFVYTFSAMITGLALGYIYHRWNSYVVSATAHTTVNIIVLTVLLLVR